LDFDRRLKAYSAVTLQGINLAIASGLLERSHDETDIYLNCAFSRWPKHSKPEKIPAQMINGSQRLAVWFAQHSTDTLYLYFLGSDNAIRD
jgi:hypothetical protein